LNSATNSFVYFGQKRWLEKRLRRHILRRQQQLSVPQQQEQQHKASLSANAVTIDSDMPPPRSINSRSP
jgi:hypothetical protein